MGTHIDATSYSAVVWCDSCSGWSDVGSTREVARRIAKEHESSVHPGSDAAAGRLRQANFRARNAVPEDARKVTVEVDAGVNAPSRSLGPDQAA